MNLTSVTNSKSNQVGFGSHYKLKGIPRDSDWVKFEKSLGGMIMDSPYLMIPEQYMLGCRDQFISVLDSNDEKVEKAFKEAGIEVEKKTPSLKYFTEYYGSKVKAKKFIEKYENAVKEAGGSSYDEIQQSRAAKKDSESSSL